MALGRPDRDPTRPVYVISVAASIVSVHPRTLRIYEDEGLICPARTPTNIRLYSEVDVRRILWIRHLTRDRGVNLAGIRILFELEERLGTRILERLYTEGTRGARGPAPETPEAPGAPAPPGAPDPETESSEPATEPTPPQTTEPRTGRANARATTR
jgi:MerR family transcriptional regulator/heat shock protein HspR